MSVNSTKDIAHLLKINNYLEELVLRYCSIGEDGAKELGSALADNDGLKRLNLSWNGIRKRGAVKLCAGLTENTCLQNVNISWNGLDREGSSAIENCLKENRTLKELDLTCNRIDCIGLKYVINGLIKNETLHTLKLSQNPMTTKGAIAVLQAIKKYPQCAMKQIDLADIPVNKQFMKCLAELYDNRSIKVLHGDNLHKTDRNDFKQVLESYDPCMVLFEYMKQEHFRLSDLFRLIDKDHSGTITRSELSKAFMAMNLPLSAGSLGLLMHRLDNDESGEIDLEELKKGQKKTSHQTNAMRNDIVFEVIAGEIKEHVRKARERNRKKYPKDKDIVSRIESALKK